MFLEYFLGFLIAHYITEKLYERRLRKFGKYIHEMMKDWDPTPLIWQNEILKSLKKPTIFVEMPNENIDRVEHKKL